VDFLLITVVSSTNSNDMQYSVCQLRLSSAQQLDTYTSRVTLAHPI